MIKVRSFVLVVSIAVAALILLPLPVSADECAGDGYRWTLRGFGAKVDAAGDESESSSTDPVERSKFALGSGEALGAELEYRMNCPVGLALGYLAGSLDTHFVYDSDTEWLMDSDDVDFSIVTLGANFHLTPRSRADFFIGPFIGIVDYDDVDFDNLPNRFNQTLDGETALGLNAGLDLPFKEGGAWALTAGLRYLATSAEGNGFELDVDPLIASAGLAYRWNGKKCAPCAAPVIPEEVEEPVCYEEKREECPEDTRVCTEEQPKVEEQREVCHFTIDSARVSNICKAKLDEVALKLKADPDLPVRIVGHTDTTGNDRINDPLSVRRAEAVKAWLIERHEISGSRIETEGHGSREPVASNDTREGRAENRRADVITIITSSTTVEVACEPLPACEPTITKVEVPCPPAD